MTPAAGTDRPTEQRPAGYTDRVRAFLGKPHVAVLATVGPAGRLQATPVWFLVEDGQILINTSRGRAKLRNMEANPRVALTIVDQNDPYAYVEIQGRAVRFDPQRGARDIDRLSLRYRGKPFTYPPTDRPANRVSVFIVPDRIIDHLR
ncbi:MAG: F420-dependent enzyme [Armatimonadetes bacterium CSP1-3]|nr:MAG: F420-dependent enzyme [Armatimonadetes bacterium CSP1-3]